MLPIALVAGQAAHAAQDARCRSGCDAYAPRRRKGLRKERPPIVDKALHAKRTVIERLIRRLQACRWLAIRYETCARCYSAGGHHPAMLPQTRCFRHGLKLTGPTRAQLNKRIMVQRHRFWRRAVGDMAVCFRPCVLHAELGRIPSSFCRVNRIQRPNHRPL